MRVADQWIELREFSAHMRKMRQLIIDERQKEMVRFWRWCAPFQFASFLFCLLARHPLMAGVNLGFLSWCAYSWRSDNERMLALVARCDDEIGKAIRKALWLWGQIIESEEELEYLARKTDLGVF